MAYQQHQSATPQEVGHVYLVNPTVLSKQFASILLMLLGLFLIMWIANWSGVMPKKPQLGDPDSTIISTKAQLATTATEKHIAFVGDSSCLVNIHIPTMKEYGIDAVNLGTLSYLGIDSFGLLAQRFCQNKPDAEIFLVVHPECIRMVESSSEHRLILMHGSSEYRIARRIQSECIQFRSYLPKGVKVRLLVSPIPQSHSIRGHEKRVLEMQSELEKWIQTDNSSVNMPTVLPNSSFGTVTHLLPNSAREYTRQLCLMLTQ